MTLYFAANLGIRQALADRLAPLRDLRGPAVEKFPEQVREVILIASSSRGGSSMVAEILRNSPSLLHFQAEINPFLRLVGLNYPESGTGSDRLGAEQLTGLAPEMRELLGAELARDAGTLAETVDDEQYALDVAWRLAVQWPELPVEPLQVAEMAQSALIRTQARYRWARGEVRDAGIFFRALLTQLRRAGIQIDPWFYDLPEHLLDDTTGTPHRAPGGYIVEEPPFVLARPWRRADPRDAPTKPLVIKTPSNAYRLGFLRALFPNARFRVLYLARNPAAAINGLYDGWLHNGFYAHRMQKPLRVSGYVEKSKDNKWWWKFDLPPGWYRYSGADLLDVCAFQWRSSHLAILADLADGDIESFTLRFEDLVRNAQSRAGAFERLSDWLGIPLEGAFRQAALRGIQPVAATATPGNGRWRARRATIERALSPHVLRVAERLGYVDRDCWI